MLTDRQKQWVLDGTCPQGRIVHLREIFGGATAFVHSVTVEDLRRNLQRLILKTQKYPEDWWPSIFESEARAIEAAQRNGIPSPRLVAYATKPAAVLMSKLSGKVHLSPVPKQWLKVMAKTLKGIHDVPVAAVKGIQRYEGSTRKMDTSKIPQWTKDWRGWKRLIQLANETPPSLHNRFTHGDYHPGNLVWDGNRLSGVIDWQGGTIGPPQRDIAHCRSNLGLLEGPDAANDFQIEYLAEGGRAWSSQRIYDAKDILAFAPDPERVWDWQGFGRPDLNRSVLRRNLQDYVESLTS